MIAPACRHIRGVTAEVTEQRKPEQFLKSQFNDDGAAFSPDGHWLAYHSNESGKDEVYVRAFPPAASGQDGKWQISNGGGAYPQWSRNGRELIYQTGVQRDELMAMSYSAKGDSLLEDESVFDAQRLPSYPAIPIIAAIWERLTTQPDKLGNALHLLRKFFMAGIPDVALRAVFDI